MATESKSYYKLSPETSRALDQLTANEIARGNGPQAIVTAAKRAGLRTNGRTTITYATVSGRMNRIRTAVTAGQLVAGRPVAGAPVGTRAGTLPETLLGVLTDSSLSAEQKIRMIQAYANIQMSASPAGAS